jgi:Bacterial SH3 domain
MFGFTREFRLALEYGRRIRTSLASAIVLATMLAASMAWYPASVLAVTCPDNGSLTGPSVSPGSGTTTTAFTFSVTYQDNAGETPTSIRVSLDGPSSFYTDLAYQSGRLRRGAIYSRTFTVPAGTWNVTFWVEPSTQPGTPQTCQVSGSSVTVSPPAKPTPKPTPKPKATAKPTPKPPPKPTAKPTPKPAKGTAGAATPPPTPTVAPTPIQASATPTETASPTTVILPAGGAGTVGDGGPTDGSDVGGMMPLVLGSVAALGGLFLVAARRRRPRRDGGGPGEAAVATAIGTRPGGEAAVADRDAPPIDDELAPIDEDAPLKRSRRPVRKAAPVAAMAGAATAMRRFEEPPRRGVPRAKVGYRQVRISSEPDAIRSTELGRLDRGDEVEIVDSHEGFLQVRTPDDITGWILRHTIVGAPT